MEKLKDATFKLDDVYTTIGGHVLTMGHIKNALINLNEDMENVTDLGSAAIFFHEMRRTVHLLSQLLRYTVSDLGEEVEKLREIKETQWNIVICGGGESNDDRKQTANEGKVVEKV